MLASKAPPRAWFLLCVFLASSFIAGAAFGAPSAAEQARRKEAKQHLTTGKKLLRENFATDAVTELERSIDLYPTWEAEEELAAANRVLGKVLTARSVYDSLLATYGSTLKGKDYERISQQRALVDRDVTRLSIDADASSHVTVDGKDLGTTPLPSAIELDPGKHEVVVSKTGYTEDRRKMDLPPGATTLRIALKLMAGKVTVQTNPPARGKVTVDGREVGDAPGTFELPPGKHSIVVNGEGAVSAVQQVEVRVGETVTLVVPLKALPGTLSIQAPEPQYRVFIDGQLRGEGSRDYALPAGIHQLRVENVGFAPYVREVTVAPGATTTVAVPHLDPLAAAAAKGPSELPNESTDQEPKKDEYAGIYGGMAVFGTIAPSATHGLWDGCPTDGSCQKLTSLGGGLAFRFGYSFGWVGIEALGIGLVDGSGNQITFNTRTTKDDQHPFYGAPRDEGFSFLRYGGGGGLGLRLSPPVPGLRPTLAVSGAYLYRAARYFLGSAADTSSTTIIPELKDHDSDARTFAVPALIVDAGFFIGGTPGSRVHLGILFIAEFDPRRSVPGFDGTLGAEVTTGGTVPVPHGVPELDVVNGTQFFIGPVLGMQFGH